ncbi:MAG: chaperone NapD [Telmatospirillum sp.]|nr:chaperone NapD [Telmatospirillum sp.]
MRVGKFIEEDGRGPGARGHHLCGVLVYARSGEVEAVGDRLRRVSGVEVHQADQAGHLVVTVEDTEEEGAGQILTRLPAVEGVLSAALIYHHWEEQESPR